MTLLKSNKINRLRTKNRGKRKKNTHTHKKTHRKPQFSQKNEEIFIHNAENEKRLEKTARSRILYETIGIEKPNEKSSSTHNIHIYTHPPIFKSRSVFFLLSFYFLQSIDSLKLFRQMSVFSSRLFCHPHKYIYHDVSHPYESGTCVLSRDNVLLKRMNEEKKKKTTFREWNNIKEKYINIQKMPQI